MKKIISFILILATLASFVACDSSGNKTPSTPSGSGGQNKPHTHAFGEWKTVVEPTCTEEGVEERVCECGEKEQNELDTIDHVYTAVVTEPTCTEGGYTTYICVCGKSSVKDRVDKTGHSFKDWTVEVAPSCTAEGVGRRECENCDFSVTKALDKSGHSFGDWYMFKEPTCEVIGSERRDCKNCAVFETRGVDSLGGHSFGDWYVETASTCTTEGTERRDCVNRGCTEHYTRPIAPIGHVYSGVETPSTTASGYTTLTCTCTDSYVANYISFAESNVAKLYVVLPKNAHREVLYARDRLIFDIKELAGVTLSSGPATGSEYELLLGNTGRPESTALAETLGEDQFAIKVEGKKIIVVASDTAILYDAICYLTENYLKSDGVIKSSGTFILKTAVNELKDADKTTLHYVLSQGTEDLTLGSVAAHTIKNEHYKGTSATVPYRRQGGCFNGTSIYQALLSSKAGGEKYSRVMKKDIATGEMKYSEIMYGIGHVNDMTYNPRTNEVFVCSGSKMYAFDADTLEQTRVVNAAASCTGFSYNYERDCYVFLSGYRFTKVSGDMSQNLGKIFTSTYRGVTQGIGSDDTFIYFLLCESLGYDSKYYTYIAVYDWYGNFVRYMTVKIPENFEPENISAVDGQIYIGATSDQPVFTQYKVKLTK